MPQLLHLDGRPQTWDELHARLADYYRPKPTRLQLDLLELLPKDGWMEAYELAYYSRWGVVAVRNAMAGLVDMGLVKHEAEGRDDWYWRVANFAGSE